VHTLEKVSAHFRLM